MYLRVLDQRVHRHCLYPLETTKSQQMEKQQQQLHDLAWIALRI